MARDERLGEVGITTLTLTTLLAILIGVTNRRGYAWALALGGVTPVGAALASGGVALPTFYAVAIGAATGLLLRALFGKTNAQSQLPVPGGTALIMLLLVALVVTLGAPIVFDNTYVLSPGAPSRLTAGVVTKSNIAQLAYLLLGVCVVFYLARAKWAGVQIVGLAVCTTTLLSLWAYLANASGIPFPAGFFDNSPAFTFQETLPGGGMRVRGILSEPAGLATSSLATIAYAASRFPMVGGIRRIALAISCGTALYLGAISTSATFFVAGAVLLVIAGCIVGGSILFSGRRLGAGVIAAGCAAAVAAIWLLPLLSNLLADVVGDKVVSSSYADRSGSDDYAYSLARATLGVGVGLGANRASSFLPSLLSTVGVLGTLLFFTAVASIMRRGWRQPAVRPAAWALIAFFICKFISGPDLADSSGLLWMSLGVMAAAAMHASPTQVAAADRPLSTGPQPTTGPPATEPQSHRLAWMRSRLAAAPHPAADAPQPATVENRRNA